MESDRSALLIAPECPYPLAGGGALRTAAILEYLARRYEVDIIVFRQPGRPDPRDTRLGDLVRAIRVIELPFHSRDAAVRAVRNLGRVVRGVPPLNDRFAGFEREIGAFLEGYRYGLAIIEHFWCSEYGDLVSRHSGRTIIDLHNIESVLHERCAAAERGPVALAHRRFAGACRRLEKQRLPRFSDVLVTSDADAATVRDIAPGARPAVYPNTIRSVPAPARQEEEVIAFSANMEYHPNTAAVRFFRHEVWPMLRAEWPDLVWKLIGMNPEAVRGIVAGDSRIRLTGPVDNAIGALAGAKAAVVPMLAGSGTRIKILEAWAAGTPVVSTRVGAEGLPYREGEQLLIADAPATFAGAVSRLLASEDLRSRVGGAGRSLYEREFTWEAGWLRLENLGI